MFGALARFLLFRDSEAAAELCIHLAHRMDSSHLQQISEYTHQLVQAHLRGER